MEAHSIFIRIHELTQSCTHSDSNTLCFNIYLSVPFANSLTDTWEFMEISSIIFATVENLNILHESTLQFSCNSSLWNNVLGNIKERFAVVNTHNIFIYKCEIIDMWSTSMRRWDKGDDKTTQDIYQTLIWARCCIF